MVIIGCQVGLTMSPVCAENVLPKSKSEWDHLRMTRFLLQISQNSQYEPDNDKQYIKEVQAADWSKLLGSNVHTVVPHFFPDFGRRFVFQYPYQEKSQAQKDIEAEIRLDQAVKQALKRLPLDDDRLKPVKAPADVVLAVARQSALRESLNPSYSAEAEGNLLRNGEYWDSVWKEEVQDPEKSLRTGSGNALESVQVKVIPGSKLYKVVSLTKDTSPQLLYVINKP